MSPRAAQSGEDSWMTLERWPGSTWGAGEDLSHEEGLGQEALHLASPGHGQLVLFAQLVHAQNGDDVLQPLVVLHPPRRRSVCSSGRAVRVMRTCTPDVCHILRGICVWISGHLQTGCLHSGPLMAHQCQLPPQSPKKPGKHPQQAAPALCTCSAMNTGRVTGPAPAEASARHGRCRSAPGR